MNIKDFPDALYRELKARARKQHRSVAQEATHILSEALERNDPLSILDLRGLGKDLWAGMGIRMVEIDRDRLHAGALSRARYRLRTPDALQIGAALSGGCKTLVTNDRDLPRIPGLRILQLKDYVRRSPPTRSRTPRGRSC